MRNLKKCLLLIFAFAVMGTYAQEKTDVVKETETRIFEVDKGEVSTTYFVNVESTEKQQVKLKEEDEGKLNQDRAETPVEVTKRVVIDDYNAGKKEIKLSYFKAPGEKLDLVATADGFAIISDDNTMHHIDEKGVYMVYSKDNLDDVVIVEEFESIR